jgi:hypothetical protein
MNYHLVLAVSALLLAGCASSSLDQAYHHQSVAILDEWFTRWHDAVPPITSRELAGQSDTVKAVYALFQTIFNPLDYSKLGAPWGPNQRNRAVRYAIIQKSVSYRIVDSLPADRVPPWGSRMETRSSGAVTDFRPDVRPDGLIRVYLTEPYEQALTSFLLDDDLHPRAGTIPHPRSQFLWPYLVVRSEGWVRAWQFATPPWIYSITFDRTLHRAIVGCALDGHSVDELLMEHRGEEWVILDHKISEVID